MIFFCGSDVLSDVRPFWYAKLIPTHKHSRLATVSLFLIESLQHIDGFVIEDHKAAAILPAVVSDAPDAVCVEQFRSRTGRIRHGADPAVQ